MEFTEEQANKVLEVVENTLQIRNDERLLESPADLLAGAMATLKALGVFDTQEGQRLATRWVFGLQRIEELIEKYRPILKSRRVDPKDLLQSKVAFEQYLEEQPYHLPPNVRRAYNILYDLWEEMPWDEQEKVKEAVYGGSVLD